LCRQFCSFCKYNETGTLPLHKAPESLALLEVVPVSMDDCLMTE
jgi:hypothetical protein